MVISSLNTLVYPSTVWSGSLDQGEVVILSRLT